MYYPVFFLLDQTAKTFQNFPVGAQGDLALFDCSLCVPVTHWACAVNQAKEKSWLYKEERIFAGYVFIKKRIYKV